MKHFSQEEKEKQRTESHESRVERDFCLHNLENREEKENWFKKSCKSRKERDLLSKNLENREEKEKWKYNSPARERKTWVISSRDFLEIETLVNDCHTPSHTTHFKFRPSGHNHTSLPWGKSTILLPESKTSMVVNFCHFGLECNDDDMIIWWDEKNEGGTVLMKRRLELGPD